MSFIYPEEELSNKRLSERRSAVIIPLRVSPRISCSECFTLTDVSNCIHCKKSFCSNCLKNNQCEECYYKYNSCLIRF